MINRVIEYINKHSMLKAKDKVIVALSGGPDSMCLIHILNRLKDELDIELYAAHVNHCLRGEEADEDERYVHRFCEEIGIPLFSRRIDINALAKAQNLSSETAGREARYQYFEELRSSIGADRIALAHNSNDQAETLLMRIMRGTGLEGLYGIKPIRDDIFIRPILFLGRQEIEDYCRVNGLMPRVDRTNYENIYNRNKIRLELIPYIQENFNKDIVTTLNRLSNIITRDNDYIEEIADKKYKEFCNEDGNRVILKGALLTEHEALSSRVIRRAVKKVKGDLNNIEMVHVNDVFELFHIGTGKMINLPGKIICENIYGDIHVYIKDEEVKLKAFNNEIILAQKQEINRLAAKSFVIKELGVILHIRLVDYSESVKFSGDCLKKYFDYDKIEGGILIRYRREGDKVVPYGMKGSKKLKDLFIDLKIPKAERDSIPLICFGEEIAWIVGYRVSNNFIVTKNTKNILEIKIEKGEN